MDEAALLRPAEVCRALLAALEAAEGRRRRRKRDTTPDAIGLAIKRYLLEQVVREDPAAEIFEAWLMRLPPPLELQATPGAVAAMARSVYDEWQMAHQLGTFREWLERGAPSDDARQSGDQELSAEK